MHNKFSITILIPVYNEAKNVLNGNLLTIKQYLDKTNLDWQIVLADDGSSDDSYSLIEQQIQSINDNRIEIYQYEHGGKAKAINNALGNVTGEWILLCDFDLSTNIDQLDKLLNNVNDSDVIIGSRGFIRNTKWSFRKITGMIFSSIRRLLILRKISDTQCGFKLVRADVLKQIFPQLSILKEKNGKGWNVSAFDVEFLFIADFFGYKIKEVIIQWENRDKSDTKGISKKFILESIDMLKQLVYITYKRYSGFYKSLKK